MTSDNEIYPDHISKRDNQIKWLHTLAAFLQEAGIRIMPLNEPATSGFIAYYEIEKDGKRVERSIYPKIKSVPDIAEQFAKYTIPKPKFLDYKEDLPLTDEQKDKAVAEAIVAEAIVAEAMKTTEGRAELALKMFGGTKAEPVGYHKKQINKGVLGEFSKIKEEFEEFEDAFQQNNPIMELVELSDILGAIEAYTSKYNIDLNSLITMTRATQNAFKRGDRK